MGLASKILGAFTGGAISTTLDSVGTTATTLREVISGEMSPEKKIEVIKLSNTLIDKINTAQTRVNEAEAKATSLFVAGWRPAVGWITTFGFAYTGIIQPIVSWAGIIWGFPAPPVIDSGSMVTILMGMLGMGGLRTYEKRSGLNNIH